MPSSIEAMFKNPLGPGWLHFTNPVRILSTNNLEGIKGILDEVDDAPKQHDLWSVGWDHRLPIERKAEA